MLVGGGLLYMFSRTFATKDEEKWKEEYWFWEMLYGPPGHYRAATALLGLISMVVGLGCFFWLLLAR